ncbi:MAG: hypothetical protein ACYTG6_04980 [Planctomycetota bacterium]|jgi:hypothetical protein
MSETGGFDLTTPVAGQAAAAQRRYEGATFVEEPVPLPFLLSPTFFIFIGALLTAGLWLGQLNPYFGPLANVWPWHLFRAEGPAGGDLYFRWNRVTAFAIACFVLLFFYVVATLLPSRRGRGIAGLAAAAFAFTSFLEIGEALFFYAAMPILAIAAGAVILRNGVLRGRGGRALVFVAVVLLAGQLFFPHPRPVDPGEDPTMAVDPSQYRSTAVGLYTRIFDRPPEMSLVEAFSDPAVGIVYALPVLLVVGLLSLLGWTGRWGVWVAGITLLVATFLPLVQLYLKGREAAPEGWNPAYEGLVDVSAHLHMRFGAFLLPLAAAVVDLGRRRARSG